MADKCKKLTATLVLCDEMALALSHNLLRLQTLENRVTKKSRERIVLPGDASTDGCRVLPWEWAKRPKKTNRNKLKAL